MTSRLHVTAIVLLIAVAAAFVPVSGGAGALVVVIAAAMIGLAIFRNFTDDKSFVTFVFIAGLAARLAFGLMVHVFDLRDFFGGDANLYDLLGNELYLRWINQVHIPNPVVDYQLGNLGTGWGMFYLVGSIYYLVGRNILAAQSFCAVVGAGIAPMVYYCAQRMFQNSRVSRLAAMLCAFFPAFIIWSGQLLKDGLIVFLLVLTMTMVLQLQRKFSFGAVVVLVLAMAGILPLRFYIFFMLAPAVAGSFVIGSTQSPKAIVRNTIILMVLGLGLTYLGATRNAGAAFEQFGSLERVQTSRADLATAGSGFASDQDVSTAGGALAAIPIGLTYLMLAPFPWQASSLRSSIPLPEVLIWWAMLPIIVIGIGWTLRNRLPKAFPILMFSLMLTIAYSIFQGNVGTAYRQRTQIQVFLFMFFAVGWVLRKEKKENEQLAKAAHARRLHEERRRQLAVGGQPS